MKYNHTNLKMGWVIDLNTSWGYVMISARAPSVHNGNH